MKQPNGCSCVCHAPRCEAKELARRLVRNITAEELHPYDRPKEDDDEEEHDDAQDDRR